MLDDPQKLHEFFTDTGAIALGLIAVMIGYIVLVAFVDGWNLPTDRKQRCYKSAHRESSRPRRSKLPQSSSFRRCKSMHRSHR